MSNYRGGRRPGRPTKEWTEYVPKGIDPQQKEDDYYHKIDYESDQHRPTEDKAGHRRFNKGPRGRHHNQDRYQGEGRKHENKDNYEKRTTEEYTSEKSQKSGLISYQKKDKRRGRQNYEGGEDEGNTQNEIKEKKGSFAWRECVVCLLKCSPSSTVWNCQSCRITCHLKCTRDWICKQNNLEKYNPKTVDRNKIYTFTCPHCNIEIKDYIPSYYCFCQKVKNPKPDTFLEPHSCGQKCGRKRGANCIHPCGDLCHSGACPPCTIVLPDVKCYCGKEIADRVCGDHSKRTCGKICEKKLNCGVHTCEKICHDGECPPCTEVKDIACHCGAETQKRKCGETFSCGSVCNKNLNCGVHKCQELCHKG